MVSGWSSFESKAGTLIRKDGLSFKPPNLPWFIFLVRSLWWWWWMVVIRVRTEKGPRAPRNLHFKVHEALRLPRNPHFKDHKVLRHSFRGSHSIAPATIICASRSTKYCVCHEICSLRFTMCCACHAICTSRSAKCCSCHEIWSSSAAPATNSALWSSSVLWGSQTAAPATKSTLQDSPAAALQLRFAARTLPTTPSRYQNAAFARDNSLHCHEIWAHRRSPPCPKCCACHEICISKYNTTESWNLDRQSTRFPLCLPRKVITISENDHYESAVVPSARRGQPVFFASLRSRNALRGFREAWSYCK